MDVQAEFGQLATEQANPATNNIDCMSPLQIVQSINAEDEKVAHAVQQVLPHIATAIEQIATRLRIGGRLIYVGAGTSGRLGALDASECPPTFNLPPAMVLSRLAGGPQAFDHAQEDLEDSAESGRDDLAALNITSKDTVVGIAASGRTPYALGALSYAHTHNALTIALVCNSATPLAQIADITIAPLVGPEVIAGSTRLKAGTAQKMVLNMLSTGTMIMLGKTFGNLMVDVLATNHKLRQRALSIVQQTTGLPHDEAEILLQHAGDDTKTAILMARSHLSLEQARNRLASCNGVLRAALENAQ